MPIGFLRSVPKLDIQFERDSYRPDDELRVRLTVNAGRTGVRVRRAVVDLVLENRYTHSAMASVIDVRSAGAFSPSGPNIPSGRVMPIARSNQRVTEEKVDRITLGRERLFPDGVIRHRTEVFDLRYQVKPPPVQRTTERNFTYMISVHFDLPQMRDLEFHKSVPVII